jgi:hypothetical protein
MKFRVFALILALSFVVWAQGSPAPAAPNASPAPEAKCCCHHADNVKDGEGCCHHAKAEGKEAMACCGKDKCEKKDAKSCCEGKDMKAGAEQCKKEGCCADGKCCAGDKGAPATDKSAASCCGNSCSRHQHAPAGN